MIACVVDGESGGGGGGGWGWFDRMFAYNIWLCVFSAMSDLSCTIASRSEHTQMHTEQTLASRRARAQ